MAQTARIGIELSSGVCRIVEIDRPRAAAPSGAPRVRQFSVFMQGSAELTAALAALRGRAAHVVGWGALGDHRQVMVTTGSYDAMRREAGRALALAGVDTRGALIDIARAPWSGAATSRRRPVVVALADAA